MEEPKSAQVLPVGYQELIKAVLGQHYFTMERSYYLFLPREALQPSLRRNFPNDSVTPQEVLDFFVDRLPMKQKVTLIALYGLQETERLTAAQASRQFGVTPEAVRERRIHGLHSLRLQSIPSISIELRAFLVPTVEEHGVALTRLRQLQADMGTLSQKMHRLGIELDLRGISIPEVEYPLLVHIFSELHKRETNPRRHAFLTLIQDRLLRNKITNTRELELLLSKDPNLAHIPNLGKKAVKICQNIVATAKAQEAPP